MAIFAYTYVDPLLDDPTEMGMWGVEVDRVFNDLGDRLQLWKLLAAVKDKKTEDQTPSYLLLRKLDELGDTLKEIGDRLNTIESSRFIVIATEQDYHSVTDKEPKKLSQLLQEIGDRQISRRIQQGHAKNRHKCLPPPGRTPYGYKRGQDRYLLDRSTAPIVQDFCENFLLYGSLRGAVRHLERRYGKKIAVSTGRKWLTSPVYRGNLRYKDGMQISNTHAAILSDSEAAQIDRLLRRNRRLSPRSASAPRCLAGLVSCQKCGQNLTVARVTQHQKSQEYLYLRPTDCPENKPCKAIAYGEVFEATVKAICHEFPEIVQQRKGPPLEAIQGQIQQDIQAKQQIIQDLPNLVGQGLFDESTANLRRYHLENEIAQLQQQKNQLPPANLQAIANTITIEQFWLDLSEAERRFYLREFLEKILISPRLQPEWQIKLNFIF